MCAATIAAAPAPINAQSIQLHRPKGKAQRVPAAAAATADTGHPIGTADQKLTVEPSETLFATLAALNVCGYDQELDKSAPLRKQIRQEVQDVLTASSAAQLAAQQVCGFYKEHDSGDPSRTLAQYVSLALFTTPPPELKPSVKEADLPPDASAVLGFLPVLQRFYTEARLHDLWLKHSRDYALLVAKLHDPLHEVIMQTDLYLKLPSASYADRRFSVLLDPQGAPGQVNARNYGSDYYIVVSPAADESLKLEQIRHTYLHYVLDPYALSRAKAMQRLEPLLDTVGTAPLDESYKTDITLLVIESLIKAAEARMMKPAQMVNAKAEPREAAQQRAALDANRNSTVQQAMVQGFILTRYFYDKLAEFEQSPASFKNDFGEMLYTIDVGQQKRAAQNIVFASQPQRDVVASGDVQGELQQAENKLAAGDYRNAQLLAQQVLDREGPESGRALFVLAMAASKEGEMQEARNYFERTLQVAKDPHVLAWSHIYLGRIADLQNDRETALRHYSSALNVGDTAPDTEAAAKKGIDHPLQAPKQSDPK